MSLLTRQTAECQRGAEVGSLIAADEQHANSANTHIRRESVNRVTFVGCDAISDTKLSGDLCDQTSLAL